MLFHSLILQLHSKSLHIMLLQLMQSTHHKVLPQKLVRIPLLSQLLDQKVSSCLIVTQQFKLLLLPLPLSSQELTKPNINYLPKNLLQKVQLGLLNLLVLMLQLLGPFLLIYQLLLYPQCLVIAQIKVLLMVGLPQSVLLLHLTVMLLLLLILILPLEMLIQITMVLLVLNIVNQVLNQKHLLQLVHLILYLPQTILPFFSVHLVQDILINQPPSLLLLQIMEVQQLVLSILSLNKLMLLKTTMLF